jgi:hypothetical protein
VGALVGVRLEAKIQPSSVCGAWLESRLRLEGGGDSKDSSAQGRRIFWPRRRPRINEPGAEISLAKRGVRTEGKGELGKNRCHDRKTHQSEDYHQRSDKNNTIRNYDTEQEKIWSPVYVLEMVKRKTQGVPRLQIGWEKS